MHNYDNIPGIDIDAVHYDDVEWGDSDLEWIFLHACLTLDDDEGGTDEYTEVLKSTGQFAQALNGAHTICGAVTEMISWLLVFDYGNGNIEYLCDGYYVSKNLVEGFSVKDSWLDGMDEHYGSGFTLRIIAEDSVYWDECIWGQGTGTEDDADVDDYYVAWTYICTD